MSHSPARAPASVADFMAAIRAGERRALARAITLIESTRPDRSALGQEILEGLVGDTGGALRVGLTGPPGVGKSSFVETLGLHLLERGQRVAVLAVDPTSPVTGGSILGDKTRMERLAQDERAFIRPSPSGGALGGVAHRTREALLLCEAAGFDVVIVETVGIGQSEVAVRALVDFFGVLLQPGAGDELQGIKKGFELADAFVNKADGEQRLRPALAPSTPAPLVLRPPRPLAARVPPPAPHGGWHGPSGRAAHREALGAESSRRGSGRRGLDVVRDELACAPFHPPGSPHDPDRREVETRRHPRAARACCAFREVNGPPPLPVG
jgi:LAO/AO transport system kinase